jgi:hypothetical protein
MEIANLITAIHIGIFPFISVHSYQSHSNILGSAGVLGHDIWGLRTTDSLDLTLGVSEDLTPTPESLTSF